MLILILHYVFEANFLQDEEQLEHAEAQDWRTFYQVFYAVYQIRIITMCAKSRTFHFVVSLRVEKVKTISIVIWAPFFDQNKTIYSYINPNNP